MKIKVFKYRKRMKGEYHRFGNQALFFIFYRWLVWIYRNKNARDNSTWTEYIKTQTPP
jgi:hypothetical protein